MTSDLKPGDRVGFSRTFLRDTGQFTGPVPFLRGVVTKCLSDGELVWVRWDGTPVRARVVSTVNRHNLVLEQNIPLEPA